MRRILRSNLLVPFLLLGLPVGLAAGQSEGVSRGRLSPEQREVVRGACAPELPKICAGQVGNGKGAACIRNNFDKFSEPCRNALRKVRGASAADQRLATASAAPAMTAPVP